MISVGQRLQQERLKKRLSIEEVAKATKIRPLFLEALEKGDYKKLPSSAYIRGFIKNYTAFLGLSQKEILALFRREFDEREFLGVLPDSFTKNPTTLPGFRLRTTTLIIIVGLLFILGFVFFQYRSAFFSPFLTVSSPKENETITSQIVTVIGDTEPNSVITINDSPVYLNKDGSFKKDIPVLSGPATIIVKAINSFGRKTTVLRHITVQ